MILPGATLGVLGGGQLGRMFAVAARTLGYRVAVLDADPDSPAAQFADVHLCAPYDDERALQALATQCAAITTEFENVPAHTLHVLGGLGIVRPPPAAVAIAQDRISEKRFLREHGFPVGRFAVIETETHVAAAAAAVGYPAILKSSRLGYDGKGQVPVAAAHAVAGAFAKLGRVPCVLEERIDLAVEISAIIARRASGEVVAFPVAENEHTDGILDVSIVPARVKSALAKEAIAITTAIAERLHYCGVLALEFFVSRDGQLLVNEMAPRPHNSGHYTVDACVTSQFEQQVRTLCDLPLGDARLLSPAVMVNILGDMWRGGQPPAWDQVLTHPQTKLHLYGKRAARPGRKMGHFTCLAPEVDQALALALSIRQALRRS